MNTILAVVGIVVAIAIFAFAPRIISRGKTIITADQALGIGAAYTFGFQVVLFSALIICLEWYH